jgi:hypothetical protein
MANDDHALSSRVRWARLRFQIPGPQLATPAHDGDLKARIGELAARRWRNQTTGESIRFSFKTSSDGGTQRAASTTPAAGEPERPAGWRESSNQGAGERRGLPTRRSRGTYGCNHWGWAR